jgi:hypothetical protein
LPEAESYQIKIRQKNEERREAKKSQRDYTKYRFEGEVYNKRRLVLAVVKQWLLKNNPRNLSELLDAFPQGIRDGGFFVPLPEAEAKCKRQGKPRHFLADDDIVRFPDSTQYAISNQWKKAWIDNFITRSEYLGYTIKEM